MATASGGERSIKGAARIASACGRKAELVNNKQIRRRWNLQMCPLSASTKKSRRGVQVGFHDSSTVPFSLERAEVGGQKIHFMRRAVNTESRR